MTFSERAVEAASAHVLRELADRGLLKDVGDDLFAEIGNDVARSALTAALAVDGLVLVREAENIRWARVNGEPFEYAIQQGRFGDEFVKLLDDTCLRRPLTAASDGEVG